MRDVHAAMIVGALATVLVWTAAASAVPQRLDCVLTDQAASPASESRPIVVVFDEDAKTVTAQEGGQTYSLENVSISNISINGAADSISLGIDRSSFGIVWQQYGADKVSKVVVCCVGWMDSHLLSAYWVLWCGLPRRQGGGRLFRLKDCAEAALTIP